MRRTISAVIRWLPRPTLDLIPIGVLSVLAVLALCVLAWLVWQRVTWEVHASVGFLMVLVVVAFVLAPRLGPRNPDPLKEYRETVSQVISALTVLAGIYLWAATDLGTLGDRVNNRLTPAADQLARVDGRGVKVIEARLAAIRSLEWIGAESSADLPIVIRILRAYLRKDRGKWPDGTCDGRDREVSAGDDDDIDYALATLVRFARRMKGFDLTEIVARNSNLTGMDLTGVKLARADFRATNLVGARLDRADLNQIDLRRANLEQASLQKATLWGACVRVANLKGVNLRGAELWSADLEGALFQGARLANADFRNASLAGADFRGVDLSEVVNLTSDQIGKAPTDTRTRLPW